MTARQRIHLQLALIATLVFALAGANWYVRPQFAFAWTAPILVMLLMWLLVGLTERRMPRVASRGTLSVPVSIAGIMMVVALGGSLGQGLGYLTNDPTDRIVGVITGVLLAVVGNGMPKAVTPFAARRCSAAQIQAINRFGGWAFVIAGAAVALVWATAPIRYGAPSTLVIVATAMALLVGRIVFARRAEARALTP